jgi:hypothetical protein
MGVGYFCSHCPTLFFLKPKLSRSRSLVQGGKSFLVECHPLDDFIVRSTLPPTFCSYPKVAVLKHFIVTPAGTLIEAQSFIEPINRHFWVGAVSCGAFVVT